MTQARRIRLHRGLGAAVALVLAIATGREALSQALSDPIPDPIGASPIAVDSELVASGLTAPVWGSNAPGHGDRHFVADQTGILWNLDLATGTRSVFLDQSARIVALGVAGPGTYDERGFLGFTFHPDFAQNGLVYTYSSEPVAGPADFSTMPAGDTANHQSVISEWQVPAPGNPASVVDPTTRREVLRIDQPQFNHNGGGLRFGPDGELYVSLGDGGGADDQGVGHVPGGNGQDAGNLLGSILRIDPDGSNSSNGQYGIPSDNPFVGDPAAQDEIYAYGLRNPYGFSFDSVTGELIAADVGQNDIEEVDVVQSGGNYGWRVKEGTFLFDPNGSDPGFVFADSPGAPAGLIDPVLQYDHDEGIAAIGGFVYRGDPNSDLYGKYVFGDFLDPALGRGRIFAGDLQTGAIEELIFPDGFDGASILGFGQDSAGELYVFGNTTGTPFGTTGFVRRIVSTTVPLPGTLSLLMAAVLGLALRRAAARAA